MFIDENDHIKVRIHYAKKGRLYEAYTEDEFEAKVVRDDEKKRFKCLNVTMRVLDWGLQNDLQDNALKDLPDGTTKFHYKTFKETKLQKTIVSWDAKDKDGNEIAVSIGIVRSLAPEVADTLIRAYDKQSLLGDEDEKK